MSSGRSAIDLAAAFFRLDFKTDLSGRAPGIAAQSRNAKIVPMAEIGIPIDAGAGVNLWVTHWNGLRIALEGAEAVY
jgi:hypothetical protein